ncbi:hypothetical protein OHS58_17990 [Amycolatopsis sp. NBC_00348]|uniref:hypothetical protein n=1 Tax=Amycolatopsis sp. NBC_00348 TaxID=2975956 RepID=UPI002E274D6D
MVWADVSLAAEVNRSAGHLSERVVATGVREHLTADVQYTGPDGVTRTETFEHQGRVLVPGCRVQIRVRPDQRRAELDDGNKHTGPIVAGGLLTLLGVALRREAGEVPGAVRKQVVGVLVVAVSLAVMPLLLAGPRRSSIAGMDSNAQVCSVRERNDHPGGICSSEMLPGNAGGTPMRPGEGIGLLVFVAFGVMMVIARFRWPEKFEGFGRVPPSDPAHARQFAALRDEDYDLVLRGGARVNYVNVTSPSASLLVSRAQIELRVFSVEPIWIARAEVTGLEWVGAPFGRRLKFRTASGRLDRVTFWPPRDAEKQLAELGWY